MKIIFQSSDLKTLTALMGNVVKDTAIVDMHRTIRMGAIGSLATFTGTDTQITIDSIIPCQCEEEADITICIYHKDLFDLSKAVPSNTAVQLDIDEKALSIKASFGKNKFNYTGQAAINFPKIPDLGEATEYNLDGDMVMQMIAAAGFASDDGLRPACMSVMLEGAGDNIRAVAGSSAEFYVGKDYEAGGIGARQIFVPPSAIKIFPTVKAETGLVLSVSDNLQFPHVAFRKDNTRLYARVLEGVFYNYKAIIPTYTKGFKFNTDEFLGALRTLTTAAGATSAGYVVLEVKNLTASLTYNDYAKGKGGVTEFELVSTNEGDIKIGFRSDSLMKNLTWLSGVGEMKHGGAANAAGLLQDESGDALQIIMPVTLPANA